MPSSLAHLRRAVPSARTSRPTGTPRRAAGRVAVKAEPPVAENAPAAPADAAATPSTPSASSGPDLEKEVSRLVRNTATTFAPRASGATGKNPAVKGTALYTIFGVQAWVSAAVGGALAFNLLAPSEGPSIARLIGMWSVWMFTVPALRARECTPAEKEALNLLFLAIPLVNITLPLVYKSFGACYAADMILLAGVFAWKLGGGEKGEEAA